MKKTIVLIVLAITGHLLFGQSQITGIIVDSLSHDPIVGATVVCMDQMTAFGITDEEGQYEILTTEKAPLVTIISLGHKETVTQVFSDQENRILLAPTDYTLDPIEITAPKAVASEFVSTTMTRLDVYQNPVSRSDPIRAINALPYTTNVSESANLSLRGSPPSETSYMLNEVPVYDAFRLDQINRVGQFSIFNNSILRSIDVFPSNPPLEFGNTTSGVVSMYTDDYGGENGQSNNLTMAGTGVNISHAINPKNHVVFFGNLNFDEGLKSINRKSLEDLEDFRSFDAGVYYVSDLFPRMKMKFFNYTLSESYDYSYEDPSYDGNFLQEKKKNLSIVNLYYNFDKTSIDVNQGFDYSNGTYRFGNLSNDIRIQNYYLSINSISRFNKWNLRTGNSWDHRLMRIDGQYPVYDYALRPTDPIYEVADTTRIKSPENFIYASYFPTDKLKMGGGVRWKNKKKTGVGKFLSAQLNSKFSFTESQSLHLGIGRYHQISLPTDSENNNASLVRSEHISLEYKLQSKHWDATAALYAKNTDYTEHSNSIKGLEFYIQYKKDRILSSLAFSSVNSTLVRDETRYDTPYDLSYFLRHIFKWSMGHQIELSSVILFREGSTFVPVLSSIYNEDIGLYEPVYTTQEQAKRLDPYFTLDITLSKGVTVNNGSVLFFLAASNLTNHRNERGISYSADYSEAGKKYFGKRVIFLGAVYSWQ